MGWLNSAVGQLRDSTWTATPRGDLVGGVTATVLALPEAMAYGIIVFAPLGPEYVSMGLIAGLIALIFSNLGAAPSGGVRIMNNGPYSLSSLMLASALTIILGRVGGAGTEAEGAATALTLLFLVVLISGGLQALFGLLKLGDLAKYIPFPVIAGLLNGTAILLFLGQVRPMLGLPAEAALLDLAGLAGALQPLTLLVGMVTVLVIWFGPRITTRIPAPFLGIFAGTAVYYAFSGAGYGNVLGPLIGSIPFSAPTPTYVLEFGKFLATPDLYLNIVAVIPLAVGIAIVVSLRTLIVSVATDNVMQERSNTNRELVGQGLGNMLAAIFGGITSAASQSRSIASYNYGARSAASRAVGGLFALAVVLLLGPAVAQLPKVALAATLVVLAIRTFDLWSLRLVSRGFSGRGNNTGILADLLVVLAVTGVMVGIGIFEAVGAGIAISLVLLVYRMGKEIIRREYSAEGVRSNVDRSLQEIELLERQGRRVRVMELEGSLFFGTADKLARSVEAIVDNDVDYIILDLRRISDLDSTGANILVQIKDRCVKRNKSLMLSSVDPGDPDTAFLRASGALDKIGRESCFDSIDDALAWAEDRLLDACLGTNRYGEEIGLAGVGALDRFSAPQLETLGGYVARTVYEHDRLVFSQGDAADRIFFIVQGRADIILDIGPAGERRRIATLCPGTIFGEMAILDGKPRSASVVADGGLTCYHISNDDFLRLNQEQPEIAYKLLAGIGQELSKRIRIANRIATELKA